MSWRCPLCRELVLVSGEKQRDLEQAASEHLIRRHDAKE